MSRLVRVLLLLPLLLLLSVCGLAWWILESEAGTRWLWQRVAAAVPGELSAGSIDGALADGFSAGSVRYADESVEVTLTSARLVATPTIFPLALDLADVVAGDVTVRLRPAPAPPGDDGVSLSDVLSMLELPFPARVEGLSLGGLRVLAADEREVFAMRGVRLAGRLHQAVELEHARLTIGDFELEAAGRLALKPPHPVDATVNLAIDAAAAEFLNDTAVRLAAKLDGDLDDLAIDVAGQSPEFRLTGSVRSPTENARWDVELRADALQWPPGSDAPLVELHAVDLASDGGLQGYTLDGAADIRIRGAGDAISAVVDAAGDTTGIDVSGLAVTGDLAKADLAGRLAWSPALAIEAAGEVTRFDLHRFLPQWPENRAVSGSLDAAWREGSVELEALAVQVENSAMRLEAGGTIDPAAGVVDLVIDWQDLQWPVDAPAPQLRSATGRISLAGAPDDWRVDGRAVLAAAGFSEGTFVLRGEGDRDQVAVSLAESRVLGGTVAGNLRYNWQDGGRWSASLAADDIHTGPVLPEWPGVLDAEFDASGQARPFRIDVELRNFAGTVRGLPVAGRGGLRYGSDELRFRKLGIESGESSLTVDGALESPEGIDFEVDVRALGTLLPSATGSFAASGNVAMPEGFPRLDLRFAAEDLGWEQYRAGHLTLETTEETAGTTEAAAFPDRSARPIVLRLDGRQVELDGRVLETLSATLSAGPDAQRIEAAIASGDTTLSAVLDGAFEDWRRPVGGWRGRLEALQLASGEVALALAAPSPLHLSPSRVAIEKLCLAGDAALSICGNGHWASARDFHADATLRALPVETLVNNPGLVVETGLEFTQTLDGSVTLIQTPEQALSGDVQIAISAGRIRNRLDERLAATTGPGDLQMHLEEGRLLSGRLHLPVAEASDLDARFEVLDIALGEESPMEGELRLEVKDIGIAAGVVPMISAASGRLAADVTMSGTVGEPRFAGEGSLSDGRLTYEALGLELTELQLRGNIRERNRLELEGTFAAGAGSGRIYTSADYLHRGEGDGGEGGIQVSLSGQNLTVVDVPNLRLVANPELDFGLAEGTVTINGRVVVPQARLTPADLVTTSVRESDDVVVVAGREEEAEEAAEPENGIAIRGEVELRLGSDIVVDLDLADAKMTGATTFRWNGPPMPGAVGQYQVSGTFQAYGQLLQITEGIINFPNVPADNPLLRIRAEREIFGNSQIRSAGVFITGTAKAPQVEVYTNPRTTESRALSLLVTGSDFNFEQGVGAVDVGTYIAPKLYLAYGIGLFERENVISLRYDIARGFGIKASSSSRTDGVDLSYTIER